MKLYFIQKLSIVKKYSCHVQGFKNPNEVTDFQKLRDAEMCMG
jgi:hypothetical protein